MNSINPFTIALITLISAQSIHAHSDIQPRVAGGKIVTDGFDDSAGAAVPNLSVFGYDFGELTDDPFFATDPGFNATSGSGLTAGAHFAFNLLGGLSFWNGAGAVSFAPVTTGATLGLNFGLQTRTLTGASVSQTGFTIDSVGAGGTVHRHLNAFLNGPDGNTLPAGPGSWGAGDGVQAADGIYLFSMQLLQDPTGGIAASDAIFIVFNNGPDETVHDKAMEWVNANLVPEPGSLAMLAGVAVCMRRRSTGVRVPVNR